MSRDVQAPMDPYRVLGLQRNATDEAIKAAYFEAVPRHAPDQDPEGFERIRRAYDWLRTPERRQAAEALTLRDGADEVGGELPDDRPRPSALVGIAYAEYLLDQLKAEPPHSS